MSINGIGKVCYKYTVEIYNCFKNIHYRTCHNMDEFYRPHIKWKKPDADYILCDSIYMKFKNRKDLPLGQKSGLQSALGDPGGKALQRSLSRVGNTL